MLQGHNYIALALTVKRKPFRPWTEYWRIAEKLNGSGLPLPQRDIPHVHVLRSHINRTELLRQVSFLFDQQVVLAILEVFQPEVAIAVGCRDFLLTGFDVDSRDAGAVGAFVGFLVEDRSRNELLGEIEVVDTRLDVKIGPQRLGLCDQVLQSSSSPKTIPPVGQASVHRVSVQPLSRRCAQNVHFWAMFSESLK